VEAKHRYTTAALGLFLALVLIWNIYRAEVETRPIQLPGVTVSDETAPPPATTTTERTMWSPQTGTTPAAP
jgi:hypothetical protein